MMARVEDVVIVGAGIAGLATAVALKRAGVEALVLEKSDGLRATGAALTLFPNAWCALDALGVSQHLTSLYAPIKKITKRNILIGCDGIHSVVARWLGLAEPVYSGRWAVRGLAVFPEGHRLDYNVQQYAGLNRRAGFVPINDKEIYWFFGTSSAKGTDLGDEPEVIRQEVIENYAKDLPPIYLDIVQHSDLSTLSWAPLMFRYPWNVVFGNLGKQNITVAGDAMHPMTPDLGQGGCLALEDAVVLGRYIGTSFVQNGRLVPKEIDSAIGKYVEERRWRVALLTAGSYLSGWVQQLGPGWVRKFLRDAIFYRFIFTKLVKLSHYDCGKLDF
ncbi:hypothetical protein COP2_007685 [Malus domestica]